VWAALQPLSQGGLQGQNQAATVPEAAAGDAAD